MRKIDLQKVKNEIARSNTIRDINKRIVLNYVRECEPISRAEIAKQTALQRSTVSSIVNALIEEELVREIGAGESSGGRKPTMLKLRRDEAVAVGVDITPTFTTIASANLAGEILERHVFPTSEDRDAVFAGILKNLTAIKQNLKKEGTQIGISVPGVVDEVSGMVSYIPFFDWKDWDLKNELSAATGMPVLVENDANAMALAESWFGKREVRGVKNFVTVLIAEGIGTGIYFNGQIYRGNKGGAGEFGHMVVSDAESDVPCSCGGNHCWEGFSSNKATIIRYNKIAAPAVETIDEIIALVRAGDPHARAAIAETVRFLADGITNLIVGLCPEAVILSGRITALWSEIERPLNEAVTENIKQRIPPAKIRVSTLGENPTLTGAVGLSLINKFASATRN